MWELLDGTIFTVVSILPGNDAFNYAFTLVTIFALLSAGVATIVRQITRT